MQLKEIIKICNSEGWLHGLEHMYCLEHCGVGEEESGKIIEDIDFVEIFNAQLRFSPFWSRFPMINNYTRDNNYKAEQFAFERKKAGIANSDAHRIEDAGIAYTEIPALNLRNTGEKILSDLKLRCKERRVYSSTSNNYESLGSWLDWVSKFQYGIKFHSSEVS